MRWVLGLLTLTSLGFPAAESASYLFELRGTPVGVVELRQSNNEFMYRSVHVLTRGSDVSKRERVATFDLSARRPPPAASLLWRKRDALGCVRAVDELSSQQSNLCIDAMEDAANGVTVGRWMGESFSARYGQDGQLTELRLKEVRFIRIPSGAALPVPPDLFGEGLPLRESKGSQLRWRPAVVMTGAAHPLKTWSREGSQTLARKIQRQSSQMPSRTCLDWAREYVRQSRALGADAVIVDGVYVPRGSQKAFPHAWVRVSLGAEEWADWDVALGEPVTAETHLALHVGERSEAGTLWLELFSGRRQVERF